MWRIAFPIGVAGALCGRAYRYFVDGIPFSWPVSIALVLVIATVVAAITYLQPTVVSQDGVKANTALGVRQSAAWPDIVEVTLTKQLKVLPSFRLKLSSGKVLWIPRETRNLTAMHELACEYGGENHPLARALRTPLYLA